MTRPRKKDRHLPPCVYPRHGAYWYVKKGVWTRLGGDLHEALEAYAKIHAAPTGSLGRLIDDALADMKPTLKPATVKQYEGAAKKLKEILAEFEPGQVKPKHAAALKTAYIAKPNMGNRILSFGRQVFDYALEHQLVEMNPFVGVRRHKEKKRERLISLEEYSRIYQHAGPRLQVIMDLCIRTGQRITAVLRIHRTDLVDKGIRFPQHKTDSKGIARWTPELRAVVDRAKALNGNIKALTLLHNRRGKPPDYRTVNLQWTKACEAAKVEDANLHDLRALAATWAKQQGFNATELLMHTSSAQTVRYLRGREEPVVDGPSFGHLIDKAQE